MHGVHGWSALVCDVAAKPKPAFRRHNGPIGPENQCVKLHTEKRVEQLVSYQFPVDCHPQLGVFAVFISNGENPGVDEPPMRIYPFTCS